ncbi:MAG TPA: GNAT family N-acetyltransferase [Acidimicrobiia bacterium]|jgi:ribosomal protein S18 acetylase RimI-like enzyme|nr:GNAT family N-acetyltransferase [Acidimicrobiia bacterium]
MRIEKLSSGDDQRILDAAHLFDDPPTPEWASRFLNAAGHHLLLAVDDDRPVGFVSGVETTHPDKGTEMFLYELGVDSAHRRQGIGTALVRALAEVARAGGCYGMWVGVDPDNAAASATYRAAGAADPEPFVVFNWNLAETGPVAQS